VVDRFGILEDAKIRRYFELGCEVKALGRGHIQRINRLLKKDVSPPERDGHAQDKDAKSVNSSAIHATEDAVLRRSVRSGGRDFVFQQPPKDEVRKSR
jgi:hypothetical protein